MTYLRGLREPIFQKSQKGVKNLHNVAKIFSEIQNTNSKLEKQRIIRENKDNKLFTDTLVFLLSPYVLTGISTKKINKKVQRLVYTDNFDPNRFSWETIKGYLEEHNTGTDKDIARVQDFLYNQPEDMRDFYIGLITKSLKLGCDAKVINAVIPNLIPTFDVMLANKYFDKPERVKGDFTITEKLDGFRLATVIHNDEIKFYSRQGQLVDGLVEIEEDIKKLCELENIHNAFFDGELVAKNCEELSSDENYKIVTKTARTKGEKRGLKYMIFDTLPYKDFAEQKCTREYHERRRKLDTFAGYLNSSNKHINILPVLYNGSDKDVIMYFLDIARERNKEGIMINLNNGMYEFKRSNTLLKVKVMQDADLKIVDVYEGTGKNKGKLGGIIIEFIHENNTYQCECGSGFDDNERVRYWNNPSEIIGKIATIQYFEISKNDNGGYGLRFPVWTHRIRDDKTEISMN